MNKKGLLAKKKHRKSVRRMKAKRKLRMAMRKEKAPK